MFAFIKGKVVEISVESLVLETNGIGYRLFTPLNQVSNLPSLNSEILLYTTLVIREYSHTLYGFQTSSDRDLYEQLMSVSGIGPKLALALIGHLSGPKLFQAVAEGDVSTLTKVPGVGKRTAERLLVELKGKLSENLIQQTALEPHKVLLDLKNQRLKDAVSALVNLGYTQANAQKALKSSLEELGDEADLPTLITSSLVYL